MEEGRRNVVENHFNQDLSTETITNECDFQLKTNFIKTKIGWTQVFCILKKVIIKNVFMLKNISTE